MLQVTNDTLELYAIGKNRTAWVSHSLPMNVYLNITGNLAVKLSLCATCKRHIPINHANAIEFCQLVHK